MGRSQVSSEPDVPVEGAAGPEDPADRLAARLAVPVLVAALASVPAIFLTLFDDPWATVGSGVNTLSGLVLVAETVVLLAVAEDRRAWLRRNRWLVLLAIAIVPAVVFAVGPVQLLRLVRVAGALRILRVRRIVKAGRIARERSGLDRGWQRVITVLATLLCAAFVAIVLADPTSESRTMVTWVVDLVGVPGILIAGLLLGGATWLVASDRVRSSSDRDVDDPGHDGDGDAGGSTPIRAADQGPDTSG